MRKFNKLASMILALVFTFSLLPAAMAANVADFTDVANHWGKVHLTKMIEAGIIAGDGQGHAMPDKPIERYEAAIMLSKVFGLNNLDLEDAITGNFTDIAITDTYVDTYINNIVAVGFMKGDAGKFDLYRSIPRKEAFTALRKALRLPDAPADYTSKFPDFDDVSDWAQGHVLAMEAAGLISGKDGKIAADDTITRAEFAAILSKAVGTFIDSDTDFEDATLNRAIIRKPGLTVENLTVTDYMIIAHGVGEGDATLEGCDINSLDVYGGGENSIHLNNTSVTTLTIETTVTGAVRIAADADSILETVRVNSDGVKISSTGSVVKIEINANNVVILAADAEVVIADDIEGTVVNGDEVEGGQTVNSGDLPEEPSEPVEPSEPEYPYEATVNAVHESVTAEVTEATETALTIKLTGELAYANNIFLTTSASDFEAVVTEEGQPLPEVLNGAFTAIEINLKDILTALGFENMSILQTNAALAAYEQDGGSKIDQPANINEVDGVWVKESADRDPATFDDAFTVLVLGGETATLVFTDGELTFTVTIDATDLVISAYDAGDIDE